VGERRPCAGCLRSLPLQLESAGYHETKRWPYAYAAFDNGVLVPDIARFHYLEMGEEVERFGIHFRWRPLQLLPVAERIRRRISLEADS
jgi:hypothetical protein